MWCVRKKLYSISYHDYVIIVVEVLVYTLNYVNLLHKRLQGSILYEILLPFRMWGVLVNRHLCVTIYAV